MPNENPTGEPRLSSKLKTQLEYGNPYEKGAIPESGGAVSEWMESLKVPIMRDVLETILPDKDKNKEGIDETEEVKYDEATGKIFGTYQVIRNKRDGKVLQEYLKHKIDGVSLQSDYRDIGGAFTGHQKKLELYEIVRNNLDPETGELPPNLGKSFLDNLIDNSLTSNFIRLTARVLGGKEGENIGHYSLGGYAEETNFLNNVTIKGDGIYFKDKKIISDANETAVIGNFLGEKFTYKPDNFGELFLNTAGSFALDMPLFLGMGKVAGNVTKYFLPGISQSTQLPARFLTHALQTNATLMLAETPGTVVHTMEGGLGAFADDLKRTAEFSLFAAAFGTFGESLGTGFSKLMQKGKNLQTWEAVRFLNRNPQITKQLTTGMTAGMLGYSMGEIQGASPEESLATGLTFASLHFANVGAWKSYLAGDSKRVMVENDTFDSMKKDLKSGKPLTEAIKNSGVGRQKYYIEDKGILTEIDGAEFVNHGKVQKIFEDVQTPLTKENVKGYKYITQTMPFAKKTMKQAWNEEELVQLKSNLYERIKKETPNPHKDVESDEWKAFNLNQSLLASHLGDVLYADKLSRELRWNELPQNPKVKQVIQETSDKLGVVPKYFEKHIAKEIVNHIKDPKATKLKLQFLPDEYNKQFLRGLFETENAIQSTLARAELDRVLQSQLFPATEVREAGLENVQVPKDKKLPDIKDYPFKKTSKTKRRAEGETEIPIIETKPKAGEGELVDEFGNPLTKKLSWREQYERDRQQGKVVPMKAGTPVDKYDLSQIKNLNSLNKALEEVDNPRALMDRIKAEAKEATELAEGTKQESKVIPVEEVITREQALQKSKDKSAKLERELLDIQEKMRKSGMSEEQIQKETYENPESEAAKKIAEIFDESANRHRIDQLSKEDTVKDVKAVKLADGTIAAFEKAESHLGKEFAELPENIRDQIVDTGIINKEGKFESTASVPMEAYKEALKQINKRLGNLSSNPFLDIGMIKDLATVGAYHLERGARTFKDWSKRMIREFTDRIKPYLSRIWQIALEYLKGERAFADPNKLGILGGALGTDFNKAKKEGKTFEGFDLKERFEISDKGTKLKLDRMLGANKDIFGGYTVDGKEIKLGKFGKLSEIYDHPGLYKNYPDAKNIDFTFSNSEEMGGKSVIADYGHNEIRVNTDNFKSRTNATLKEDITHEIQHWIQQKEGFTTGLAYQNVDLAKSPRALDKLVSYLTSNKFERTMAFSGLKLGYETATSYAEGLVEKIGAIKSGKLIDAEHYSAIQSELYRLSAGELESRLVQFRVHEDRLSAPQDFAKLLRNRGIKSDQVITEKDYTYFAEPTRIEKEPKTKNKLPEMEEGAIRKKRTPEEEKHFEKINDLFKRYKPKNIYGQLKGTTLDPESYAKMNNLNTLSKMKPEEIDIYKEQISKDLAKLEEKRTSEEITHEEYERLESIAAEAFTNLDNFGNLEGKEGAELKNTLNEMKTVITEGKTRHKILEDARKARMDTLREMIKQSMGNKETLSETQARIKGIDAEPSNLKETVFKGLSDAENTYLFGLGHILQKMFSADYRAGRYIMERTKQAEGREADGLDKWEQAVQTKVKEIYGLDGKELLKTLEKNKEVVKNSGVYIGKDEMPFTQNEAYKKYMEWQDKKYGEPTLRKMGFTDETIAQIEKFMTPEIKKWADWQVKEFYSEYYKPVNEVYRRMYYVNLPQHENYSPLKRNVSRVQEDNLMKTSMSPIASALNYSLYHRTNSRQDLAYVDGDQVLMSHIAQMEHFKAWGEHIRELRSILQHSEIKNIIKQNYGDNYNVLINNYINDLARGSVLREKVYPLLDKVRNNFTTAVLSIPKLNLFPQQLSSMAMYATKIPTAEFLSGFTDMLSDPMAAYKTLYENSANFRARYKQGFDRDIKDVMALKDVQKLAGVRSLKDALMFAVKMGDKFAVVGGGYSVWKYHYDKAIKDGLSPQEAMQKAINKFDVATDETQQSSKLVDLSDLQRGGSIGKLFTMFQSQPNLYYRATSMAIRDLARGKGEPRQHIKTILLAHFALPMLFQFISDFGWDTKHQIRAGVIGSFNGIFALGDFISNTVSALQNDLAFGIESVPIMDAPNKFFEAAKVIGKMSDDGEIDMGEVLSTADKLASGVSRFAGIPYDPTKKVFAGAGVKANKEGIGYSTENINLKRLFGVSELAIKDSEMEMKEAKRRMTIYKKKYQRTADADDRRAYIEARREYERMVKELKLNERKK